MHIEATKRGRLSITDTENESLLVNVNRHFLVWSLVIFSQPIPSVNVGLPSGRTYANISPPFQPTKFRYLINLTLPPSTSYLTSAFFTCFTTNDQCLDFMTNLQPMHLCFCRPRFTVDFFPSLVNRGTPTLQVSFLILSL